MRNVKRNKKVTSTKEVRKARFKLVWSIVAFLYFISGPKTAMSVILNIIPLAAEIYEEFDEGSLVYKIFAIAFLLVFLFPAASVFKLVPEWDWFKYLYVVNTIQNVFFLIKTKK